MVLICRHRWSAAWIALTLLTTTVRGSAAEILEQAVRTHRFEITLAPKDKDSRDVRTADLFITRDHSRGWRFVGPCRMKNSGNDRLFTRWVRVPADGIYYFRTRAGDDAGKPLPPTSTDKPEARVVVDSISPVIHLGNPMGGESFKPGEIMPIRWQAEDSNFSKHPIRIDYSDDNGKTWKIISASTVNDGREDWTVPLTRSRSLLIRITAKDRAGNISRAVTRRPVTLITADNKKPPAASPPPPVPQQSQAKDETKPDKTTPAKAGKKKFPWLDANNANLTRRDWNNYTPNYDAYTNYIIAGNLARQGKTKDSLRYYNAAVSKDEEFCDAWNDLALVYRHLGSYGKAIRCINKALELQPHNPEYNHTAGEVFQAKSFHLFHTALGDDDLSRAVQANSTALKYYNRAIQEADKQGRMAERGSTYFRIGEICYFVNQDPVGARMYWQKVLSLHTPQPNLDDVMLRLGTEEEEKARKTKAHYTKMWVELATWQKYARSYLDQLDELERQGLIQSAPHANNIREQEMPPTPPRELPQPQPMNRRPGNGFYNMPGYGSKPAPGSVQKDIPVPHAIPVSPSRNKQRSKQRHKPLTGDFATYPKYKTGGCNPNDNQSHPPARESDNTFWEYRRR